MFSKNVATLLFSTCFFALVLSACTTSTSECRQNSECAPHQYCASGSGGVFFEGGICINKDRTPNTDALDASNLGQDTDNDEDSSLSPDALLADAQPENNDITESDSDDSDTTPPAECISNDECSASSEGEWGECTFELPCDTEGVQKRDVSSATCENSVCISATTTEERACTRETENIACGQSTNAEWSECSYDGKKTRQTFAPTCKNSVCTTAVGVEELPCTCTNNASCGGVTYGPWKSCKFETTCASTGLQSREVKTPTCTSGACSIVVSQEQKECNRESTDGLSCGQKDFANWGTCSNPNACASTGTQTRQVESFICENDTCKTNIATETQNCALTPKPTCGNATYSNWSTCTYASTCANSGNQSRTKTTPTCQNGMCNGVNTTETRECGTRNTDSTVCGDEKLVEAGKCEYVFICDNSGNATPDKYVTPICKAGACTAEKIDYKFPKCTRNTDGLPCGGKVKAFCNHGCCGICE